MDIHQDTGWLGIYRRVHTERAGTLRFQPGIDPSSMALIYQRVVDADCRLRRTPAATQGDAIERELFNQAVHATDVLENGTLSRTETADVMARGLYRTLTPGERRIINLRAAYDEMRNAATTPDWRLDTDFVRTLHGCVTDRLAHDYNRPGELRDNPTGVVTRVGQPGSKRVFKPPQKGSDIAALLDGLIDWHTALDDGGVPALIRAPLVHYYFKFIHPFWDGNGRVARALETTLLMRDGVWWPALAMPGFYLDNQADYGDLFGPRRSFGEPQSRFPNHAFVAFFLAGMRRRIEQIHDRLDTAVTQTLLAARVTQLFESSSINARQYAIARAVLDHNQPLPLVRLRKAAWYRALYDNLTSKTRYRDLRQLQDRGLLVVTADKCLTAGRVD